MNECLVADRLLNYLFVTKRHISEAANKLQSYMAPSLQSNTTGNKYNTSNLDANTNYYNNLFHLK